MSVARHFSNGTRPRASLFLKHFTLLTAGATILGALSPTMLSAAVKTVTFTEDQIEIGGINSGGASAMVSGDFNNDGILDLVTINGSGVSFYKGLGAGKYATPVIQTLSANPGAGPLFAADFNGDGKLDLASAYGQTCCGVIGPVTILLGNGDGTFRQGTNITVTTDGVTSNAETIALADFNGDHKPDIAISDSGNTWIYLGNGDGTFKQSYATSNGGGASLVAGDFNADGKQDLVFGDTDYVGLLLGNGDGTMQYPIESPLSGVTSLAVGDFYNTRVQTLAALAGVGISEDNGEYIYVYSLRYEDGGLFVENPNLIAAGVAAGPYYIAGGDLNGDFKTDIALTGGGYLGSANPEYMLGNGNGTFESPQNIPFNNHASVMSFPLIRDLNLDSREDIEAAWLSLADDNGGAEVLLNTSATKNCAPPAANKLSVNICAPKSGEAVASKFTFKAAGNTFNGIAKRMELWIDGKKVAQNLEDQLKATISLSAGKHTASFVVVDSFDETSSSSVTFTAN
jgi:hypothetical protein